MEIIYQLLIFIWIGVESYLYLFHNLSSREGKKDQGSFYFLVFFIGTSLLLSHLLKYLNSYPLSWEHQYFLCFFLLLSGISLRVLSIWTLKKMFTIKVCVVKNHELVSSGIYKYIRHPSYSALILNFFAVGIHSKNIYSLLTLLLPSLLLLSYRIKIEEDVLLDNFKEKYVLYKSKTKKLIPFIY